jgi:hypothetical protein
MHLKVFLKLENPKNSLFWANKHIYKKNKKNQKPKKTHWAGFFFTGFFPTLQLTLNNEFDR